MLRRAAPLVNMDPTTRALAEGVARYAAGDAEGAHATLATATEDGADPELYAALLALRVPTQTKALGISIDAPRPAATSQPITANLRLRLRLSLGSTGRRSYHGDLPLEGGL